MDVTTGEVVYVDFDCLFDKGTTLARPEIVPFRLTPELVDAFGLTGVEGSFRRTMEVSMTVLRENRDTLLSVLEPFLRDPTVAWGRSGHAQRSESAHVVNDSTHQGYADIENTEAKEALDKISGRLRGVYNLAHPHAERIKRAYTARRLPPPYRGLCAMQEEGYLPLSVPGQVDRLILESTAVENLVQMYIGWCPWM